MRFMCVYGTWNESPDACSHFHSSHVLPLFVFAPCAKKNQYSAMKKKSSNIWLITRILFVFIEPKKKKYTNKKFHVLILFCLLIRFPRVACSHWHFFCRLILICYFKCFILGWLFSLIRWFLRCFFPLPLPLTLRFSHFNQRWNEMWICWRTYSTNWYIVRNDCLFCYCELHALAWFIKKALLFFSLSLVQN